MVTLQMKTDRGPGAAERQRPGLPRPRRYRIKFPRGSLQKVAQSEAFFYLDEPGERRKIRFHDYAELYRHPGLYEQLFYDRLRCQSPRKVATMLHDAVRNAGERFSELRVFDVGAGNGIVGEALAQQGVARLVGVDIIAEARDACERDRPGLYDAYYIVDLAALDPETIEELAEWHFDAMTCVAALGFGDIPTSAFARAFNLVRKGGWVAFNIKETFLHSSDDSGFSTLVKQLLHADTLELHHLERYAHRISIDGTPLHYYAVVARKHQDIPAELVND